MADRRMFTKKITESDVFLDMPSSAQALYFHLSMNADDDGFINNPRSIQRTVGASNDDMKLLLAKQFIIVFETGVIVIKHWKIHNYIRSDRYKPTDNIEEKALLSVDEKNAYVTINNSGIPCGIPSGIPTVVKMDTQVRLGKDSIDNINIYTHSEKNNLPEIDKQNEIYNEAGYPKKKIKHKYGEYQNVLLTDDEFEKLNNEFSDLNKRIDALSGYIASTGKAYKSHYATIRQWAKRDKEKMQSNTSKWSGQDNKRNIDFDDYEKSILSN